MEVNRIYGCRKCKKSFSAKTELLETYMLCRDCGRHLLTSSFLHVIIDIEKQLDRMYNGELEWTKPLSETE